jgi:hypothetical protein
MKATYINENRLTRHDFSVEHEGNTYKVVIWTNEKGKFIDEEISLNDNELEGEGTEGDVRAAIIDYLDDNWEKLVR